MLLFSILLLFAAAGAAAAAAAVAAATVETRLQLQNQGTELHFSWQGIGKPQLGPDAPS